MEVGGGKANKVKETVGLNDNARQEVEMTSDEKVKANEGGADRTGNAASDAKPVIKRGCSGRHKPK